MENECKSNVDYREETPYKVYIHIIPKKLTGYDWDKYYIGITKRELYKRFGHNGIRYKNNEHFYRAITKYGWNNIKHELVASNLTHDEANKMEQALIKALNSNTKEYGYNHSIGGDGGNMKELKSVDQYNFNGELLNTFDSIVDASKYLGLRMRSSGITCNCKGKSSSSHGYIWRYHGEPIEEKYKYCMNKKIVLLDLMGNFVKVFNNIQEACSETNTSLGKITNSLYENGNQGKWKFYDEYMKGSVA